MIHPHKKIFVSLDVTFFENTSFLQKTSLQGENDNEACFLDFDFGNSEIENATSSPTKHHLNHYEVPWTEGNLNSEGDMETQNNREMLVYSRSRNLSIKRISHLKHQESWNP